MIFEQLITVLTFSQTQGCDNFGKGGLMTGATQDGTEDIVCEELLGNWLINP